MNILEAIENLDLEAKLSDLGVEWKDTNDPSEKRIKTCPNPECGNDKYKLYINLSTKKFFCFICQFGYKNNPIHLLAAISGRSYRDVKNEILGEAFPSSTSFVEDLHAKLDIAPDDPPTFLNDIKNEEIPNRIPLTDDFEAYSYALKRGLTKELISHYDIVGSPQLKNFKGKYLVFPIKFGQNTVCYQGRDVRDVDMKLRYVSGPKINNWLFPLNLDNMEKIQNSSKVMLVEGPFDAVGGVLFGMPTLATFGKHLSTKQLELLEFLGVKEIYLAWDADAKKEIMAFISKFKSKFKVKLVRLGSSQKLDFGNFLETKDYEPYEKAIKQAITPESLEYYLYCLDNKFNETAKTKV